MGTPHELKNRIVVIKTWRKHGNGGKGGGRRGETGKRGYIYQVADDGSLELLATKEGSSFKDVSRQLHATDLIPRHVALNRSGKTSF